MNFIKKWYTYQKERFPIIVYGIYVLGIVFATFFWSTYIAKMAYYRNFYNNPNSYLMGAPLPYKTQWIIILPMFIVAFLQFLMVRIIDEFKDYEEDCKYRAYRPVPRGLITLKELKVLFIICVVLQLIITFCINKKGIVFLFMLWLFFAIMSKNFFIKKFLDKHILFEVFLDEFLMPFLILYLCSFVKFFEYSSIWKLLTMSYIISWIIEIARKIRCKDDEENGVKTYTAVFGIKKAVLILFILETLLVLIQTVIIGLKYINFIIVPYVIVNLFNLLFIIKQNRKYAKTAELSANMYILITYLSLVVLIL